MCKNVGNLEWSHFHVLQVEDPLLLFLLLGFILFTGFTFPSLSESSSISSPRTSFCILYSNLNAGEMRDARSSRQRIYYENLMHREESNFSERCIPFHFLHFLSDLTDSLLYSTHPPENAPLNSYSNSNSNPVFYPWSRGIWFPLEWEWEWEGDLNFNICIDW